MAKGKGQKVNRKQLADVFGVSLPTIDAWLRAGCPFDQRGGSGKEWIFDTADVVRWREQRASDEAGGADVQDETALKKRKLSAEVRVAELDLMQKMGMVAPLDQVERVLTRTLAEVQSNLRGSLVTRLAAQLVGETDERKFKKIALAEIDVILESLASIDVTDEEAGAVDDEETDDDA
ncbi:MAG TPA: terminase small subunit [Rhodanobacter sp.]|nr:terminase small subunit [Rhodanobacter sp.]